MTGDDGKLAVGRIVKAFGVRGEVVVEPMTDDPERFRTLRRLYLGPAADSSRSVSVRASSIEPRGVRLRISGIEDRAAAEHLTGQYLFVGADQRLRLPDGRHFVHEMVGLRVIDQNGMERGTVRAVHKLPAHDLYEVATPGGGEFLLPAVHAFIREVDIAAGVLRVDLIEGLADE